MAVNAARMEQTPGVRVSVGTLALVTFAMCLFVAQAVTGTAIGFAGLVFAFVILTGLTIRSLGGIFNLFGLSVAVLSLQQVIVAMVGKVVFLSPADKPLHFPYETMLMYCVGMFALFLAAQTVKILKFDKIRPIFPPIEDVKVLTVSAYILTALSVIRFWYLMRFGVYEGAGGGVYIGGVVGPVRQLTFLGPLSVAMSTAATIIGSKNKRCVSLVNGIAIGAPVVFGIVGAIRADTASAMVTFLLTCFAFRFRFRMIHYAVAILAGYAFQFILFPYALYARGEGKVREGAFEERIVKAFNVLGDVALNPGKYEEEIRKPNVLEAYAVERLHYYGESYPTLDRYSMVIVNDEIVNAALREGTTGWHTIYAGWDLVLPRILNPGKEAFGTSNWIAHHGQGIVGAEDYYTQITLSFFVDGFLSFLWPGVFFCSFMVGMAYFTVYRILMRPHLFGNVHVIALAFLTTWIFSEGTIQAQTLLNFQYPVYYTGIVLPVMIMAASLTRKHREAPYIHEREGRPAPT